MLWDLCSSEFQVLPWWHLDKLNFLSSAVGFFLLRFLFPSCLISSQWISKWVCWWGQVRLVTVGGHLQPNRQKEHLFQVPWMSFLSVCLTVLVKQDKAHPHVVLSTFQSMMRAAQSLDVLTERVTQSRHGFVFLQAWGPGSRSIPVCSHRGQPYKGACRSQRPSLNPRQGGLHLSYLCLHPPDKDFTPNPLATSSRSSLSSLLKILHLVYPKSPDLKHFVLLPERITSLFCLVATFYIFKGNYRISPQPSPPFCA